jgi:hypothetical protein
MTTFSGFIGEKSSTFANRVNCFAVRFLNCWLARRVVISVIVLAAFFLASAPRSAPQTVAVKWPVLVDATMARCAVVRPQSAVEPELLAIISYPSAANIGPPYSVVPWGLVCCHLSAPKVSGAASRSRVKIVAEGEIVPGWQGDDDCLARRIGQAEGLTNGLPR